MWLIFAGILLMLGGLTLLFSVVANLIAGGAWLAGLGFIATLSGMVIGLCGIGRRLSQGQLSRKKKD